MSKDIIINHGTLPEILELDTKWLPELVTSFYCPDYRGIKSVGIDACDPGSTAAQILALSLHEKDGQKLLLLCVYVDLFLENFKQLVPSFLYKISYVSGRIEWYNGSSATIVPGPRRVGAMSWEDKTRGLRVNGIIDANSGAMDTDFGRTELIRRIAGEGPKFFCCIDGGGDG